MGKYGVWRLYLTCLVKCWYPNKTLVSFSFSSITFVYDLSTNVIQKSFGLYTLTNTLSFSFQMRNRFSNIEKKHKLQNLGLTKNKFHFTNFIFNSLNRSNNIILVNILENINLWVLKYFNFSTSLSIFKTKNIPIIFVSNGRSVETRGEPPLVENFLTCLVLTEKLESCFICFYLKFLIWGFVTVKNKKTKVEKKYPWIMGKDVHQILCNVISICYIRSYCFNFMNFWVRKWHGS